MHTKTAIRERAREIAAITLADSKGAAPRAGTQPTGHTNQQDRHMPLRAVAVAAMVLTAGQAANAQVDARSEYTPLVTSTGAATGFKDHFSPYAGNLPQTGDTVALSIQAPAVQSRKWRAFLPPGTKRLYADVQFAPVPPAA